jgi:hypothetical protein
MYIYITALNYLVMKKITSLFILLLLAGSLFSHKTARINRTSTTPEIDGFIEDTWDRAVSLEKIDVDFQSEVPTIGNSTWQALWDNENFYCVVFVDDDNHWPGWESGGNSWEYDKPEFYWDVNRVLKDSVGAGTSNSGHYQLSPGFADGSYDMCISRVPVSVGSNNPGGTFAYSLIGEGYVYEIAVPWANMPDKNGNDSTFYNFQHRGIGFDVTVVDQDEGVTTARQRANWNNAGAIDEAWNNMDDAGIIYGSYTCGNCDDDVSVDSKKLRSVKITPNPFNDQLSVQGGFDRVELFNNLGKLVKETAVKSRTISVSELPKGVYILKAYKQDKFAGVAKVIKN